MPRGNRKIAPRPVFPKAITAVAPPGVPTPNYTGFRVHARRYRTTVRVAGRVTLPGPVIGAPVPSVAVPRYMGLSVHPVPRHPVSAGRIRLTKLRLVPRGGFVGAKLGFLTVNPTRQATFTVQPTRSGTLTTN
jgi:hypothetical protein